MNRISLSLISVFQSFTVLSQELDFLPSYTGEIIKHKYYTLSYQEEHEQPEWVAYYLDTFMLKGMYKRKNSFRPDPLVSTHTPTYDDYNSAKDYDAGHLLPCRQMQFDCQAMAETFYMSNMSPQHWQFNRHKWSDLERLERNMAWRNKGVYVVTGPVLKDIDTTIGITTKISVPKYYYKVILSYHEGNKKAIAFLLPNKKESTPFVDYVVSIDSLEAFTGSDFFPSLEDVEEDALENYSDKSLWNFENPYLDYGYTNSPIKCGATINNSISPININTASPSDLETLPGIGEVKAKAIISSRPFRSILGIKRVSGIGEATFQKLKPLITVGD